VVEGGKVPVKWLTFIIYPLLLAIGITGWLILDTRLSALEERTKANRSAELHLEQAQDIVRVTNDLCATEDVGVEVRGSVSVLRRPDRHEELFHSLEDFDESQPGGRLLYEEEIWEGVAVFYREYRFMGRRLGSLVHRPECEREGVGERLGYEYRYVRHQSASSIISLGACDGASTQDIPPCDG